MDTQSSLLPAKMMSTSSNFLFFSNPKESGGVPESSIAVQFHGFLNGPENKSDSENKMMTCVKLSPWEPEKSLFRDSRFGGGEKN